ncbi:GNAT family protein [Proteinivorax hydrogeniformans]|uniref:GNAT family protein n=1 Tax=Proteinivorax hydrogeniformans TaxID=1826727 RepID=A0AAU8HVU7_9FIRM
MLEKDGVLVRCIEENDLKQLYQWLNVQKYRGTFQSLQLNSMAGLRKRFESDGFLGANNWLMMVENNKALVGLFYVNIKYTGNDVKVASIGLVICQSNHRSKGIGKKATELIIDYIFGNYSIHRIEADTDIENLSAQNVLKRCGFSYEGTLRGYRYHSGKYVDHVIFSILKSEWKNKKENV